MSQQRFIASMQGRDATFSTSSDERFNEAAFEVQLTAARTPTYPLALDLQTEGADPSGDYEDALSASNQAKALLSISAVQLQMLDYFYYTALTVATLYEKSSDDTRNTWRELLTAHREQLREWAENFIRPPSPKARAGVGRDRSPRGAGRRCDASVRRGHSIGP